MHLMHNFLFIVYIQMSLKQPQLFQYIWDFLYILADVEGTSYFEVERIWFSVKNLYTWKVLLTVLK